MSIKKIALVGNPNTGKSSLFNHLTGLNQQIGNFPGVTVEKKSGMFHLSETQSIEVVDLPGTYSVFPRSRDEKVVLDVLTSDNHPDRPDILLVIADVTNLERNLLLFSQVKDLKMPCILVLTMQDLAEKRGLVFNLELLKNRLFGTPVICVNGRSGEGIQELRKEIQQFNLAEFQYTSFGNRPLAEIVNDEEQQAIDASERYAKIRGLLNDVVKSKPKEESVSFTSKLDKILVHPIYGYGIFIALLLIIFQTIFNLASFPMDLIDGTFLQLSQWAKSSMSEGVFTNLIAEGVIPGIGGVVVFVPQIALLFFFLALLEESGYMARVVFIMDKLVRPFGLNGKSVVPLMSSVACAIPGIMATRTISSWKDRIITIMVAPLMSCSARIPVYTLLIALIVPDRFVFGLINLKGLVLFGLYTLGLVSALAVAWVLKRFVKTEEKSFLLLELPPYRLPRWNALFITLREKVRVFVFDAGKVILAISILLWGLASYGPGQRMDEAAAAVPIPTVQLPDEWEKYDRFVSAARLENSYIGILGKSIEPFIRPLGYDWKIGVSLITSFAAREVFVGSMATIYSVGEDFEEDHRLLTRLEQDVNPTTGLKTYTIATGASLMIFYVYAMQCMATLAVVKRETKSWKWPLFQLAYMGVLAYVGAWITYLLLS